MDNRNNGIRFIGKNKPSAKFTIQTGDFHNITSRMREWLKTLDTEWNVILYADSNLNYEKLKNAKVSISIDDNVVWSIGSQYVWNVFEKKKYNNDPDYEKFVRLEKSSNKNKYPKYGDTTDGKKIEFLMGNNEIVFDKVISLGTRHQEYKWIYPGITENVKYNYFTLFSNVFVIVPSAINLSKIDITFNKSIYIPYYKDVLKENALIVARDGQSEHFEINNEHTSDRVLKYMLKKPSVPYYLALFTTTGPRALNESEFKKLNYVIKINS